jgi:hypothetical protein
LRYLGLGELTGYMALAGIPDYPEMVVAVEDSNLSVWWAGVMRELVCRHPRIAMIAVAVPSARCQEI